MYIACPKCDWRPRATSRWICSPGCNEVWNTFDTHGICPGCGKGWQETMCLACKRWSDHEDWYHDDNDLSVEDYIQQFLPVEVPLER